MVIMQAALRMANRSLVLRELPNTSALVKRSFFPKAQTRIYTKPRRTMSTGEEIFWGVFFVGTMLSVPVWVIATCGRPQS